MVPARAAPARPQLNGTLDVMNTEESMPSEEQSGSRFVGAVAEVLVALSALGFVGLLLAACLAAVMELTGEGPAVSLGSWTLGVALVGTLLWLARGLRRRRNWARIGLVLYFGGLAVYNALWLVTEWHLNWPLLHHIQFPNRNPGTFTIVMTAVYSGVAVLLSGPTVRSLFRRHDA